MTPIHTFPCFKVLLLFSAGHAYVHAGSHMTDSANSREGGRFPDKGERDYNFLSGIHIVYGVNNLSYSILAPGLSGNDHSLDVLVSS